MNWISVDDQLPEIDKYVIYHAPGIFSDKHPQMWIGQFDGHAFYSRAGFFGGGEVTHWMYLPLLPGDNNDTI